jgi:hypothetical protein
MVSVRNYGSPRKMAPNNLFGGSGKRRKYEGHIDPAAFPASETPQDPVRSVALAYAKYSAQCKRDGVAAMTPKDWAKTQKTRFPRKRKKGGQPSRSPLGGERG